MVTPAYFENDMKDYENQMSFKDADKEKIKEKAVKDTVHVLKQYGYDSGAESFERIMNYGK